MRRKLIIFTLCILLYFLKWPIKHQIFGFFTTMANDFKITQIKQRAGPNPDMIKTAVLKVVNKEGSVRQNALAMNLKKTNLKRHVNNYYKKLPDDGKKYVSCVPRYNTKQIFTAEQELSLINYLITSTKMQFGLGLLNFFYMYFYN